jgi:hypothetical protein
MVGSFDKEFCDGFMDALIERWFQVDPTSAFASIEALEEKLIISPGKRWAGSGAFSAALARSPRKTLLDALPANATWPRSDSSIPAAFTALAARDPAAARRYLERITDPESRKICGDRHSGRYREARSARGRRALTLAEQLGRLRCCPRGSRAHRARYATASPRGK